MRSLNLPWIGGITFGGRPRFAFASPLVLVLPTYAALFLRTTPRAHYTLPLSMSSVLGRVLLARQTRIIRKVQIPIKRRAR